MPDSTSPQSLAQRDLLIEQHRTYVRALAVKVMRSFSFQVDLNELIAYGELGLIEAAERFDPRRRVAFSTFSYYRIKGAIYDGLREMGYLSRPSSARARFEANANDALKAAGDDEQAGGAAGVASLDDEIALAQASIDDLIPIYILSLDADDAPDIADENALSNAKIEQKDLINFTLSLLKELSTDEQRLIDALYFKHTSMTHLAAQLGVTKSWISRLHTRAIKHLREAMEQHGLLNPSS